LSGTGPSLSRRIRCVNEIYGQVCTVPDTVPVVMPGTEIMPLEELLFAWILAGTYKLDRTHRLALMAQHGITDTVPRNVWMQFS